MSPVVEPRYAAVRQEYCHLRAQEAHMNACAQSRSPVHRASPYGRLITPRKVVAMHEVMRQGLYDPRNEHDSCGVGFVVNIKGRKSHDIITQGLKILENLDHRGAVGADPLVGDGAGCLIQMPDALLNEWARAAGKSLPAVG
ncbi:MAG TPA: hypothetical protein PLD10_24400, partial [Rhodopila sp.]|nr:hypothetical protein [Rhodopila sp.]